MLMTWALLWGLDWRCVIVFLPLQKLLFFFQFTYYLTAHYTYYVIDLPSLLPDLSATATLKCLV